jgi:Ras homolog enriched in brain
MAPPTKQRKIAIVGSRSVGQCLAILLRTQRKVSARVVADCHTGKSSLTVQYCEGHFVESYYPTIENTFSHEILYKNQKFATEIVDTAGQV